MLELSEERLKNDEKELEYYGFSSTDVYISYREAIDKRFKSLMVVVAEFYDEKMRDPEDTNQMLLKHYKDFWASADPVVHKFYDEIQKTLALPESYVPECFITPQDVFCNPEIKEIEKEIQSLEDQYMNEKFYLHALQQRNDVIEKVCLPLKSRVDLAKKVLKDNDKKMEHFEILDAKRAEKTEKILKDFDKEQLLERMLKTLKDKNKEKAIMKEWLEKWNQMKTEQ